VFATFYVFPIWLFIAGLALLAGIALVAGIVVALALLAGRQRD
jgi:hypothetical protein